METSFTPLMSLAGGALIGLAATLLMLSYGRILGATGIVRGVILPSSFADASWRVALLLGMVSAPIGFMVVSGTAQEITVPVSTPMLIIGGLLVGLGVTFGGGCTSGHGVCGNARFSPRSMVATICFMICAAATVFLLRHIL